MPEIQDLNTIDRLILAAARPRLADEEISTVNDLVLAVDHWDCFSKNALQNGVGPQVYKNLTYIGNYSSVPEETFSSLKQSYYISVNRNENFFKSYHEIVHAFSAHGISVIPLKGIFLAESIYAEPGLRPMSDIDFLVRRNDAEKCQSILIEAGYKSHERYKTRFLKRYQKLKHLPPMVSGNVSVELHVEAHSDDCEYKVNVDKYWENAKTSANSEKFRYELAPNDLLQYLCLHLDFHIHAGRIQLYFYTDIAAVLKFYSSKIDWETFKLSCEEYCCSKNVYRQLFLAHKYFNAPLPACVLQEVSSFYDSQTEKLFIHYLKGEKDDIIKEVSHSSISKLRAMQGAGNKLRYIINDTFPSVTFMKKRYQRSNIFVILWYYLVRIKTGIKVFWNYLFKSEVSKVR